MEAPWPDLADTTTHDLQHEVAMFLAERQAEDTLCQAMLRVLHARSAPYPVGACWWDDPSSPFKKRLIYTLSDGITF